MAPEGLERVWECGRCRYHNFSHRTVCNHCRQPRPDSADADTSAGAVAPLWREGLWDCARCRYRNFSYFAFCNRCHRPRPVSADADNTAAPFTFPGCTFRPRGDWTCTGCGQSNYAGRKKCRKCDQPKMVAAMPAIATPGTYFPIDMWMAGNSTFASNQRWAIGSGASFGHQLATEWPFHGSIDMSPQNLSVSSVIPIGWQSGDWLCNCGFRNYSFRMQCEKCDAPMPKGGSTLALPSHETAADLGTKRLTTNEFSDDWKNKNTNRTIGPPKVPPGFHLDGSSSGQANVFHSSNLRGASQPIRMHNLVENWQSWDWLCNCGFHNHSLRMQCEKCDAPMPKGGSTLAIPSHETAADLGTKRLTTNEFSNNRRSGAPKVPPGFHLDGSSSGQANDFHSSNLRGGFHLDGSSSGQANDLHSSNLRGASQPIRMHNLVEKGGKHWRNGDWICTVCNLHNFASQLICDRCKASRAVGSHQPFVP